MSTPIIFALPCCEARTETIAARIGAEPGEVGIRRFPDGESYVRIRTAVDNRPAILVGSLDRPDDKVLQLLYLARALRDQGATSVGLVAPYLAYMRQDRIFQPGEGLTSRYFADLLSSAVDWLVTVDPHLHRYRSLGELYSIPSRVVHAAPAIADWVRTHVRQPVFVGPDEESAQWVAEVATLAAAPHTVLVKERHGDRDVEVSVPDLQAHRSRTPVLVDDIISTARTMIETVGQLRRLGMSRPICIGVHAIFAGRAYEDLLKAGVSQVVTCATVNHVSNGIDLAPLMASGISELLNRQLDGDIK